eukprot:GHRR01030820.1.p1 GENE.GHRR01030820.1~~GHRR01030820.1.p1  ORF type:complete len:245 (-),score=75.28 GHRR01030820.1:328-1062(-)
MHWQQFVNRHVGAGHCEIADPDMLWHAIAAGCRLWDVTVGKSRQVLRGHVDSVNEVGWQPYGAAICTGVLLPVCNQASACCNIALFRAAVASHTHNGINGSGAITASLLQWLLLLRAHVVAPVTPHFATFLLGAASSDKTVSTWDPRSGLSTSTFYGHKNSCNHVSYNLLGTMVVSTDADGVVKLWDVRMVAEILTIECSKYPANKAAFDASGAVSRLRECCCWIVAAMTDCCQRCYCCSVRAA